MMCVVVHVTSDFLHDFINDRCCGVIFVDGSHTAHSLIQTRRSAVAEKPRDADSHHLGISWH